MPGFLDILLGWLALSLISGVVWWLACRWDSVPDPNEMDESSPAG